MMCGNDVADPEMDRVLRNCTVLNVWSIDEWKYQWRLNQRSIWRSMFEGGWPEPSHYTDIEVLFLTFREQLAGLSFRKETLNTILRHELFALLRYDTFKNCVTGGGDYVRCMSSILRAATRVFKLSAYMRFSLHYDIENDMGDLALSMFKDEWLSDVYRRSIVEYKNAVSMGAALGEFHPLAVLKAEKVVNNDDGSFYFIVREDKIALPLRNPAFQHEIDEWYATPQKDEDKPKARLIYPLRKDVTYDSE